MDTMTKSSYRSPIVQRLGATMTATPMQVLDNLSDDELAAIVRGGDAEAFDVLYHRHAPLAKRIACRRLRSVDAADDVVSEVFAGMLQALRGGRGPVTGFVPYLCTSVRNQCIAHGKRGARVQPVAWEEGSAYEQQAPADVDRSDEAGVVARAFSHLQPRWQQALWMSAVEQRTPAEVADRFALNEDAASALVYRARKAFAVAYLDEHTAMATRDSCRHVASSLARYVRGQAGASDVFRVESHLEDCEACRRAVAELRDLNSSLRTLPGPAAIAAAGISWLFKAAAATMLVLSAGSLTADTPLAARQAMAARASTNVVEAPNGVDPRTGQPIGDRPDGTGMGGTDASIIGSSTAVDGVLNGAVPSGLELPGLPGIGAIPGGLLLDGTPLDGVTPPTVTVSDDGVNANVPLPGGLGGGGINVNVSGAGGVPGVDATVDVGGVNVGLTVDLDDGSAVAVTLPTTISVPVLPLPPITLPPVSIPAVSIPPITLPNITLPGLPVLPHLLGH